VPRQLPTWATAGIRAQQANFPVETVLRYLYFNLVMVIRRKFASTPPSVRDPGEITPRNLHGLFSQ
jgi:hypothetical protein